MNLAVNAAKQKSTVAFFSLEMLVGRDHEAPSFG